MKGEMGSMDDMPSMEGGGEARSEGGPDNPEGSPDAREASPPTHRSTPATGDRSVRD